MSEVTGIVLRVSLSLKRDPRRVARMPFAWTCAVLLAVLQHARASAVEREADALALARFVTLAVFDPDGYRAAQRDLRHRAALVETPDEARAGAEALLARARAAGFEVDAVDAAPTPES